MKRAIVLRGVEKRVRMIVSLKAPGEQMEDAVIKSAANRSGKGSVGAESVGVDVSGAEHRFGKGPQPADRNRDARTEQQIIHVQCSR